MNTNAKVGVVLVSLLLVVSVLGASAMFATDRTVTDTDHVAETFEEEGAYETVVEDIRERLGEEIDEELEERDPPEGITIDADGEAIATQAVTESFIASEFGQNIELLMAFFKGDSDEIDLSFDVEPLQEAVASQFEEKMIIDTVVLIQEQDIESEEADTDDEMLVRLNEDQEGYETARLDIRSQGLEDFPAELDSDGSVTIDTVELIDEVELQPEEVDIDDEILVRVNEDREGYEAVRLDIRNQTLEDVPAELDSDGSVNLDTVELVDKIDSGEANLDVTAEDIEQLNEGLDGYAAVRADIRDQVKSQAPPGALSEQIDEQLRTINDELQTNTAEQTRDEYGDDVADDTLDRMIALQHTVIDGLTDPDLDDFEEYETQRDADREALETSLDEELDESLGETGDELKENAAEDARDEYEDDLSEEAMEGVIALQNTVTDGLTAPDLDDFETYEAQRDANRGALEASLDDELDENLSETAAELKEEAAEEARDEYEDDLSEEGMEDLIALQNTVIDGLTDPDLSDFEAYEPQRTEDEDALKSSIIDEIRNDIDGAFEQEADIDDEFDEDRDEFETLQSGIGLVNILLFALPLLALALIGALYAITRSINLTVITTGGSLLVAGLLGVIISLVVNVDTLIDLDDDDREAAEAAFFDGFLSVIDSLFEVLMTQSSVLVGAGVVLVGVGYADCEGYLDGLKGATDDADEDQDASDDQDQDESEKSAEEQDADEEQGAGTDATEE